VELAGRRARDLAGLRGGDGLTRPAAAGDRAAAIWLGIAVTLFLLLVGQAYVTNDDGGSMLEVARSLVHDGGVTVPAHFGVPGSGGAYYSKYGLLLPLLSVIPVGLAQPLGMLTGHLRALESSGAAALMPLVGGALAAALFVLGRRIGAPRPAAALVAAGTVLGTYLLPYGRDFFSEPLVALGVVVMVERVLAGRESQAGIALALAVLARPQSAAFSPLLALFVLARGGGLRGVLRAAWPLAIAAALTVGYNVVRFGDALDFGYRPPVDPGFTTPIWEGASGLLFSPEKSVLLFAPAIVLVPFATVALWRRERATAAIVLALFGVAFLLDATWHSWEGGWAWGPRLLIPGVAVVLVVIGPWIADSGPRLRAAGALFAAGFALSFAAVIAPLGLQLLGPQDALRRRDGTAGPQIVRQYAAVPRLARRTIAATGGPGVPADANRNYIDLWQALVYLEFGRSGLVAAAVGTLVLLAALLWSTRIAVRAMRA
jgi:hypothetical protein